jgi:ATP-binding cassette subfamily B protein
MSFANNSVLRQLAHMAASQRRWFACALVLTALCSLIAVLQPWPLKILADLALAQNHQGDSVQSLLSRWSIPSEPATLVILAAVLSIVVALLNSGTDACLSWVWTVLGQRLAGGLSAQLLERLFTMPFAEFRRYSTGDLMNRLGSDTWAIAKLINSGVITPITTVLSLLAMLIISWRLSPELCLLAFITTPLIATATVFFSPKIKQQNRKAREAHGRYTSFVQQTLSAMPLMHVFNSGERNSKRFAELAAEASSLNERALILNRSNALVTGAISVSGTALIIYFGGTKALAGEISTGTFLLFISYVRSAQGGIESLLRLYQSFQPRIVGLERVLEILGSSHTGTPPRPVTRLSLNCGPAIQFQDVTFGYGTSTPVLSNFNFEIKAGEAVALVGGSGAGKSTVLNLIARLYDPESGGICINGTDLRDLELNSVRQHVAYMFQESFLLRRSIRENISYGIPDANIASVMNAARQARADSFISRLPEAYETVVAERGLSLSGGERQRVATARTCLQESRVILMDEPTSACDAETEADLIRTLQTLARERTVVIVAHRLSTIRWVDRIVVLDAGRIIETGSHSELLNAHGKYYQLHQGQNRKSGQLEVTA